MTIIGKLQAATYGSSELDLEVMKYLGLNYKETDSLIETYFDGTACRVTPLRPLFSSSIDAAMSLIPEGWFMEEMHHHRLEFYDAKWLVSIREPLVPPDGGSPLHAESQHQSLPIAICIAAIRAKDGK